MERTRPEEPRVYRNLIENLESLKRREGTTVAEMNTLVQIQKNLASIASLASGMAGFPPPGPNAFRGLGLGLAV